MRAAALALAVGTLSIDTDARAVAVAFDPPSVSVGVGSPASVELVISGLGDLAAPSLGAFELQLTYDPAILSFTGVAFGDPVLGAQLDLFGAGSVSGFDASVAGTLDLFETSLDLPEELDAQQAGTFTLLTLSFTTLALGTSALEIAPGSLLLGDSLGDPLTADGVGSGSITAIPEPATAVLTVLGVALLALVRKTNRSVL